MAEPGFAGHDPSMKHLILMSLGFSSLTAVAAEPAPDAPKPLELRSAQAATLLTTGFQTGWLVGTKLWVSPVRNQLAFPEYAEVQGGFNDTIGPVAPFMMTGTALVNVAPLIALRREPKKPAFVLHAVGFLFNAAILVPTLALNVPVNDQTSQWTADQTPPEDWQDLRQQWETGHTIRASFAVAGLLANTVGTFWE